MNTREIAEEIKRKYEEKYEEKLRIVEVKKNNGVKKLAWTVESKQNMTANIYVENYEDEEDEYIIDKIYEISHAVKPEINIDDINDWNKMKYWIIPCIVNTEKNKEELEDLVNVPLADLSVIFRIILKKGPEGLYTTKVTKRLNEMWENRDPEELMQYAQINLCIENPPQIKHLLSELNEIRGEELFDLTAEDVPPMYIITNANSTYGAAAILAEDFMKKNAQAFKKIILIPSSIHEWILINDTVDKEEIRNIIRSINSTKVDPEEVLSDHEYYWTPEKGLYYEE